MRKKEFLAKTFQRLGFLNIRSAQLRKSPSPFLRILAYHRVADDLLSGYPFDENVISTSIKIFAQQVTFIKNHFDPITLADLKNVLEGNAVLPDRPLMITFDDGYADNYSHAFPILKQYNLPATFFVTTNYMGTPHIFWWEKVAFWIKREQILQTILNDPSFNGAKDPALVIHRLKSLENRARVEYLALWEEEYPISNALKNMIRPLNWDEIREMSRAGMEIGSHTETHPVLSKLPPDALVHELTGSKKKIETEIGKAVIAIAYPGGKPTDHNSIVHQATEAAGYTFGLTYDGGINRLSDLNRYVLKRIAVECPFSLAFFKSMLLFPRLFSNHRGNG